ncbi:hypothetical protein [Actinomadura coerulea]|uniref:hypothetical protein n=1 Tax=Actinomadura coerulea TaxID=46159 RepID=UPI00341CABA9
MGKKQRRATLRQQRAEKDAQYRAALGVPDDDPLPAQAGISGSAGAARGGRGAAQRRSAPLRQPGLRVDKRPAAMLKLTSAQVRTVQCPRCLAPAGAPCRNSRGETYPTGHADRHRRAAAALGKRRGKNKDKSSGATGRPPAPRPAPDKQRRTEYAAQKQQRQRISGTPSTGGGHDPMAAVFTARRGTWVDNGDGVLRRLPGGNRMANKRADQR